MLNLVFMGPPGSGKGTQAAIISKKLGLELISVGDLLREESESKSKLGQQIDSFISVGELVPLEIISLIMKKRFLSCEKGFLFDGIPRTIEQAIFLDDVMKSESSKLDYVIEFQVAESDVIARLKKRYICCDCHAILSISEMDKLHCNLCMSSNIERRDDDSSNEAVKTRINIFNTQTEKIRKFYKKQNILCNIDASKKHNEVTNSIISLVC